MYRWAGAPWFAPSGTTSLRPAQWLESFLGERGRQLLPLQRRGRDVRFLDATAAHGDELGENADGDLLGGHRTDVEADRCVNVRQAFERHSLFNQGVVDLLDLRLAADQTDVAQFPRGQRPQSVEIVAGTARTTVTD